MAGAVVTSEEIRAGMAALVQEVEEAFAAGQAIAASRAADVGFDRELAGAALEQTWRDPGEKIRLAKWSAWWSQFVQPEDVLITSITACLAGRQRRH